MTSGEIVRIARQRAGLTQQQLADRSGHPRETIVRWERGVREPSLASLRRLVEATGLDLVLQLAERDPSLRASVDDQLELTPVRRLKRLLPSAERKETIRALRWLAGARTPAIVIGDVAGALQGAPNRPRDGRVELVSADHLAMEDEMRARGLVPVDTEGRWAETDARAVWMLPKGGALALASNVPGTEDYRDLRRSAETVELDETRAIRVAHPRDLLRMAEASRHESGRALAPGLRALLERRTEA